ncbi:hypothetical protein Trydic_g7071 [Trypoxylus dichotomus]
MYIAKSNFTFVIHTIVFLLCTKKKTMDSYTVTLSLTIFATIASLAITKRNPLRCQTDLNCPVLEEAEGLGGYPSRTGVCSEGVCTLSHEIYCEEDAGCIIKRKERAWVYCYNGICIFNGNELKPLCKVNNDCPSFNLTTQRVYCVADLCRSVYVKIYRNRKKIKEYKMTL